MKQVQGIVMDWAGTAVDFGCFAPLGAFLKMFKEWNIDISYSQAREPMGMLKIDHIRTILQMADVDAKFRAAHGREWNEEDVKAMNAAFEKHLFASLSEYTDPIPGVIGTIAELRAKGLKIGSTTGFTAAMMDVVRPAAAAKGYTVDNLVTPDGLPAGRPAPYMVYKNMIDLAIDSPDCVVKVGDTIADIREGLNAKVWSVGIVTGSNELGLDEAEYKSMPAAQLAEMKAKVRNKMIAAGADFVLDNITELPACIEGINARMQS